jgi:NAD(P)-dependent dehydrogenase (short-subunit alcohol dehydrogenase family)
VRVNCVSPGGVFNHQGDDFVGNYSQRTPMNRMATDQDICGAVIFLATPEAGYVSGQNIVVDGGFTAW